MRRLVSLCLVLASCGGSVVSGPVELTVFAAASLTDVFREMAPEFERESGARLTFNFASSESLATAIRHVGGADVFASAGAEPMERVAADVGVVHHAEFATNMMVIVVPPENPARIAEIAHLARPGVDLVLAAESVPAGRYARGILRNAGAEEALRNVVSNEPDVRGVVGKVTAGEADAGIVYLTDVASARVKAIAIDRNDNVVAVYPIAVVADSPRKVLAARFVDWVTGRGRSYLATHGFGTP